MDSSELTLTDSDKKDLFFRIRC